MRKCLRRVAGCGGVAFGAVFPWLFLGLAAVLSILNISENWNETAAYFAFFGLLLMSISYVLQYLANRASDK